VQRLARIGYSALLWLAVPAYLIKLWWRGRVEPVYRMGIGERFGFYGNRAPAICLTMSRPAAACGCMRCRWAKREPLRR
jgi:3-deoxy-D-manno-octulosonic-acid transferase